MIDVDSIYEETLLYDFYGSLLTEKQRSVFEEVILNDYSLSEVADDLGITRQGAHDMIRRTKKTLIGYEEKLALVEKFLRIKSQIEEIRAVSEDERVLGLTDKILEEL